MFNSSKIAQLTEQLEEAQTALANAQAVAEQAEAKAAELMAQIEAKDASISNLQAELEKANEAKAAEVEKIKAEHDAKIEASVQRKVIERCASAGITEPIASDPKAIENPSTNSHLKGRARVAAAFAAQFSK